jgi:hypothetical protein
MRSRARLPQCPAIGQRVYNRFTDIPIRVVSHGLHFTRRVSENALNIIAFLRPRRTSHTLARPNNPVERTAHSAGSVLMHGSVPVGRRSPGACVPGMAQNSRGGSPRARYQRSRRRGEGQGRASRGGVWRKPTPHVRGDVQEPDRRCGTTRDAWARDHQVLQPRVGGAVDIRRLGTDSSVSDPGRSAGGSPARRTERGGIRAYRQAAVSRGPSVCLAARVSGGLKSRSVRDHGPIAKGGGHASPAGERGRYGAP